MVNALTSASTLLAFLRHADRVKIGCMTSGLGTLVATDREHVWRTAAYYPFAQLMRYGQGESMETAVECDCFDIPGYAIDDNSQYYTHTGVKYIDAATAYNEENGELNIFVINRDWENDCVLDLDVSGFEGYSFVEHIQMFTDDMTFHSTFETAGTIQPSVNSDASFKDGKLSAEVKKLSWNVFRFKK